MRIAVAGGTGVVGAHVVRELRARGHAARVRKTFAERLTGEDARPWR